MEVPLKTKNRTTKWPSNYTLEHTWSGVVLSLSRVWLLQPHGLYSLPGSSVCGILQVRILKWVAISFSRGSSQPSNQTRVSCIAGRFFTTWAIREALWLSGFLKGMHQDFHGLDSRSLILYTLFPLSQFLEHRPVWKGLIHSTMLQCPLVLINPVALSVHKWFPP